MATIEENLAALKICIERGKPTKDASYPPDMKGQPGSVELTAELIEAGVSPESILNDGMVPAMRVVGQRFQDGEAFVPDMLISAGAMKKAMVLLEDVLKKAGIEPKGTFIAGTVEGDLHDIGKNLVCMMVEGNGWKVVDLGVDTTAPKFVAAADEHPDAVVGMSALLTTTMLSMRGICKALKEKHPDMKTMIGGAPVSQLYAEEIGATGYGIDPWAANDMLDAWYDTAGK